MAYKVKIDIFEGPFDLLVYLIESAEMNIYDIQVAQITSQYLAYLEEMESRDIIVGGEFMLLAAVLIELKSKMLLPRYKPEGEISDEDDPRKDLVAQLLEYKRFKHAAELLAMQQDAAAMTLCKPQEDIQAFTGEPDEYLRMDLKSFMRAFQNYVASRKRAEEIRKHYTRVSRQRESVNSKIGFISNMFRERNATSLAFRDLLNNTDDREDIVLTFIAILEMVRKRTLRARQEFSFGEIRLIIDENPTNEVSVDSLAM